MQCFISRMNVSTRGDFTVGDRLDAKSICAIYFKHQAASMRDQTAFNRQFSFIFREGHDLKQQTIKFVH